MKRKRNFFGYLLTAKGMNVVITIYKFIFMAEILACFADECPAAYLFGLEKVFVYKMDNVIPVVAITWGVVSIPISFLFGKIGQSNSGIQLLDLLVAGWGRGNIMFLIISFVSQLVFILISVTYEKTVFFTVVAWTQIMYVCLFFYLVALSISHEAVRSIIKKQTEYIYMSLKQKYDGITFKDSEMKNYLREYSEVMTRHHWILKDMIKNLNYLEKENVENLENILEEDICSILAGRSGRKMVYELFEILLSVANPDTVNRITSNVFSKNIGKDARKSILGALLSERKEIYYEQCAILLEKLRDESGASENIKEFEELLFWGILWGNHQRLFIIKPEDILQNQIWIDDFRDEIGYKKNLEHQKSEEFNELVWDSCLDFMLLTNIDELNPVIENIFICKMGDL